MGTWDPEYTDILEKTFITSLGNSEGIRGRGINKEP